MEMLSIDPAIAKGVIHYLHEHAQPAPGLGDLVLKIDTSSGERREGLLVEQDGESSPEGILLNDGGSPIRDEEMASIGFGHGV